MPEDRPQKGDQIIFFDVESLPCESDDPLWLKLSGDMRPEKDEGEEAFLARKEQARRHTSLMTCLGRPWMIGWALGKADPVIHSSEGSPSTEKALLEEFWEALQKVIARREAGDFIDPWWVGHNIEEFDIPFIQTRALHHDLPDLARVFGKFRQKPWERRILDTMKLWPQSSGDRSSFRQYGFKGAGKLDTICNLLGIEQQDGVMGTDVYQAWLDKNLAGVASHLHFDICQVRDVFKRLWPFI